MLATVKTIETNNNVYYLGYAKQCKLTLSQLRNKRYRTFNMMVQKVSGLVLIASGVLMNEMSALITLGLFGVALIISKDQIIRL